MASVNQKKDPWSVKVGGSGSGDFKYELLVEGTYPGTIVGLYDIGEHEVKDMKKGETYLSRKLIMVFEMDEKKSNGEPFVLVQRYTFAMVKTAHLYKLAKNVLGSKFREDATDFNVLPLMGCPVMVAVSNTKVGDKSYHNVESVSSYPKGFPAPESHMTQVAWSVSSDEPLPDSAASLPFIYGKSIRQLAEESQEWKARSSGEIVQFTEDGIDDIPF